MQAGLKKRTINQLRLAQERQTRPLVTAEFVQGKGWFRCFLFTPQDVASVHDRDHKQIHNIAKREHIELRPYMAPPVQFLLNVSITFASALRPKTDDRTDERQ
jgi:hypothetical protein